MKSKKMVLITFGVALVCLIGYSVFNTFTKSKIIVEEKKTVIDNQDGEETGETILEVASINDVSIEEEFPDDLTEGYVQQAIHDMSHQKVKADKKWGFLPLTQERVERLIEVVELNKSTYQHANTYLSILERWSNQDFSRVDADHNAIWDLQYGTIGKATGILSAEEEREYIKKHFNIVEKK